MHTAWQGSLTSGQSRWKDTPTLHQKSLLPQNWVQLFLGVKPKDITKPKIGRRKGLLLAASKENTGESFPKRCLSKQHNWGSVKLSVHTYSWRGLSTQCRIGAEVHRVQALVDWSHEDQKTTTSSSLRFLLIWWLRLQANLYHWNRTGSLYHWYVIFAIVTSLTW